jgi:formylglycine-generating enzyme required for sulfatase activity
MKRWRLSLLLSAPLLVARGQGPEGRADVSAGASFRADEGRGDDQEDGYPQAEDDWQGVDGPAARSAGDGGARHPGGSCPKGMVRADRFCIDRFEAPNRRGDEPLVMQSAHDAEAWCSAHGKRLCTEDEWIAACEGRERRAYPYGPDHEDGRCNDDKTWRPVDEAKLARWPAEEAKAHAAALYQATPSGAKPRCASAAGAYDMTGNVEEWVVKTREHANGWPYVLIGCYWSGCYGGGKPTCHSTNNAHAPAFRFYETGFRCCVNAAEPR